MLIFYLDGQFSLLDELAHHIIRLSGIHILEMFWKVIGKQYESSGLDGILVEANILVQMY